MSRKRKKTRIAPYLVIILIIILLVLLFLNFNNAKVKLEKDDKALVIGSKNVFAVYEDKLIVKIPKEISINSNETIKDLVDTKNYEKVLETINDILPQKLDKYVIANGKELESEIENLKNIPEINVGDKRHILTSSVNSMFSDYYGDENKVKELNENVLIDVLNANGRGGYARKTGEMLKENFGVKYNAANYEKEQQESYVIVKDMSKEKVEEILDKLAEKYFKIKTESTVPTLANLVVVLGKENNIDMKINLFSKEGKTDLADKLTKAGYKNVTVSKSNEEIENSVILYAPEDYYIARKIGKQLGIDKLIDKQELKNKIEVLID